MSYCRFSSMNFMCDVYVYADVSGRWTTHVAGKRLRFPPIPGIPFRWLPKLGDYTPGDSCVRYASRWRRLVAHALCRVWDLSHDLHQWSVNAWPKEAIPIAFAGDTFHDGSAGECAARLETLKAMGYSVPQLAIDALRAEEADAAHEV